MARASADSHGPTSSCLLGLEVVFERGGVRRPVPALLGRMSLLSSPARLLFGTLYSAVVVGSPSVGAQTFADNTTDIPTVGVANQSDTHNIDFGDVDLDGDWDAVFADGGDCCLDQSRIWMNQGGVQGGVLGVFEDRTSTRFPVVSHTGRDLEFVDFDGDDDLDLYVNGTSTITNQANRWWVNLGGDQGGATGFFADETAARWVDLDGAGSSLWPGLLLPTGGFIDWTSDGDFADLDNDGDLDLVHSSYGGQFTGGVPTRVFLNDGEGYFREFNPAQVKLVGRDLPDGTPAIWCEGLQQHDTLDSSGQFCDIASTPLDIELADLDGDWDLDLILGGRDEWVRLIENRLEENGGALGFRDVTFARLAETSNRHGNYEQELGDVDGDGDLDLLGINWGRAGVPGFDDVLMINDGSGNFGVPSVLPQSGADDVEGDFLDADGDGDLDLLVASFSSPHRYYRNDGGGIFTEATAGVIPASANLPGLDVEVADVDRDGDPDAFLAHALNHRNVYLQNTGAVPDVHAPRVLALEQAPDRVAGIDPTVVRVHVLDNTSMNVTRRHRVWLEVSVLGGAAFTVPMSSSGGQIFRGEIPGALSGVIQYRALARDAGGLTGSSGSLTYTATGCAPLVYCTAAQNPSSTGCVASLSASDPARCPTSGANDYDVRMNGSDIFRPGLIFYGLNGRATVPFSSGQLCVQAPIQRTPIQNTGALGGGCTGWMVLRVNDPSGVDFPPGTTVNFQAWLRDPGVGVASDVSDGLELTVR